MTNGHIRLIGALYLVAGLVAFVPLSLTAQDSEDFKPLFEKKWALEMGITQLNPASFNGASLSIRKNYAHNRAFRIGLGADFTRMIIIPEVDHRENITNTKDFYLFIHKLYYKNITKSTRMQLALGPFFGWRRISGYSEFLELYTETINYRYYVGWHIICGFEFKVLDNFGIMCDIGPNIRHTWTKTRTTLSGNSETIRRERLFEFDLASPRLGMAFYF